MLARIRVRIAAAICRNTNDFPGRWRLVRRTVTDVRTIGRSMRPTVVRTKHGFRMRCELEDWVGQYIFVSGSYEETTASLVSRLVVPGSTVVDVGANVGFYTLLFSKLVGPSGRVIALEPMPLALERLQQNLVMNRVDNVDVHAVAAAADRCEASFFLGPPHHTSESSLKPREGGDRIRVQCALLDDLLGDAESVSLLKIDAEGAEPDVLAGASRLLDRGLPHIIAEVSSCDWPDMLLRRGYRMYCLDWNGLRPVTDPQDSQLPSQYNALFTMDESVLGTSARG